MKIIVTGGSGGLGSEIVQEFDHRGEKATPASRRTGFDLATGAGMAEAITGADVIVHAASHPARHHAVDVAGTDRLATMLRARVAGTHLIYVSIVGCDRNPFGYYRSKTAAEKLLADSGLPVTVVRATQFHTLVDAIAETATIGPLGFAPHGLRFQPCDVGWVARRIVDYAMAGPPDGCRRADDLAGPELMTLAQAISIRAESAGHRAPRMVEIPAVGNALAAFADGANLPDPGSEIGGPSFTAWTAR